MSNDCWKSEEEVRLLSPPLTLGDGHPAAFPLREPSSSRRTSRAILRSEADCLERADTNTVRDSRLRLQALRQTPQLPCQLPQGNVDGLGQVPSRELASGRTSSTVRSPSLSATNSFRETRSGASRS